MAYDPTSREAAIGAAAETEAARIMQRRGIAVLPVYGLLDNTDETKAPMVYAPHSGVLVAPDILAFTAGEHTWIDVKGKTAPSWHRNTRKWEHGIDYRCFLDYAEVGRHSALPVYLLLREFMSPADPRAESTPLPSDQWLCIRLDRARAVGQHRARWPLRGGDPLDLGRDGMGGWLWPREAMSAWHYDDPRFRDTPPAGITGEQIPLLKARLSP